nr:FAD-binding oxidoreductase [Desulfobacterales bacterium]
TRTPPGGSGAAGFETRITARRPLSSTAFELSLETPAGFTFIPGQRVHLLLAGAGRDYSILSAPGEAAIRLLIRRVEGGRISSRLAATPVGAPLSFTGPHGYFTFKPSSRRAVFTATGTGIAPFCAMAAAGVSLLRGKAALYVGCVSERPSAAPGCFAGRVTGYLQERLPAGAYDFYLCGRQEMVRDATLIADERFPGSLVFSEVFY